MEGSTKRKKKEEAETTVHLSHGPCKEDGPVQHPAASWCPQAVDEDNQQGQSIEEIYQHLQGRRTQCFQLEKDIFVAIVYMFLQTDHNPGKADGVFEVGLILVNVGEAGVEGTVEYHLEQSRRKQCDHDSVSMTAYSSDAGQIVHM